MNWDNEDEKDTPVLARDPAQVEKPGYGPCPQCNADVARGPKGHTTRERSPDGKTRCGNCGHAGLNRDWGKERDASR